MPKMIIILWQNNPHMIDLRWSLPHYHFWNDVYELQQSVLCCWPLLGWPPKNQLLTRFPGTEKINISWDLLRATWNEQKLSGWWFGTWILSWECHHPNWRTHILQRDWNHQPGEDVLSRNSRAMEAMAHLGLWIGRRLTFQNDEDFPVRNLWVTRGSILHALSWPAIHTGPTWGTRIELCKYIYNIVFTGQIWDK